MDERGNRLGVATAGHTAVFRALYLYAAGPAVSRVLIDLQTVAYHDLIVRPRHASFDCSETVDTWLGMAEVQVTLKRMNARVFR